MNLTTQPLFAAFWALFALLVILLAARRAITWRRHRRDELARREAEYTAALDEAALQESVATPEMSTAAVEQPAVTPEPAISQETVTPAGVDQMTVAAPTPVINAERYQAWSSPTVETWQPPVDGEHSVSWTDQELFHQRDEQFEEPDYLPRVHPGDIPSIGEDDLAFGSATPFMASLLPAADEERIEQELMQAGFYQPHAKMNLQASRVAMILGSLLMMAFLLIGVPQEAEVWVMIGMIGVPLFFWAIPRMYIQNRAAERRSQLERAMPDMLDMLNMCVSQGLTIPDSLRRISRDLKPVYPILASELAIAVHQADVGSMGIALNNFAKRVDVPEVDSFVTLMTQSEKMGTNVSDALTEYSNTMRESLRQRTDEKANNASFKLMFPTVLCMMPAVFLFLMGPAILELENFFDEGGMEQIQQASDIGNVNNIFRNADVN